MKAWFCLVAVIPMVMNFTAAKVSAAPRVIDLNGNGEHVIGTVDGHAHIVIRGRIGKLVIRGKIDGRSILDLSGLDAGEVVVEGKIDGRSTVTIRARGRVYIGDKIDGQSRVTITGSHLHVRGKVDGQTSLTLRVPRGNVRIDGGVHGGSTVTYP